MVSRLFVVSRSVFMGSPGVGVSTSKDTAKVEPIPLNFAGVK